MSKMRRQGEGGVSKKMNLEETPFVNDPVYALLSGQEGMGDIKFLRFCPRRHMGGQKWVKLCPRT